MKVRYPRFTYMQDAIATYMEYNTITTVRLLALTDAQFPSVTVCNLNPLRKSVLKTDYPAIYNLMNNISALNPPGEWMGVWLCVWVFAGLALNAGGAPSNSRKKRKKRQAPLPPQGSSGNEAAKTQSAEVTH